MKRLAALLLIALLACSRGSIDRAHWQRMTPTDKTLYVRSLLGAEKVKDRKGGNARRFDRSAEEYVAAIDAAYARGDARDAGAIFESMGTTR